MTIKSQSLVFLALLLGSATPAFAQNATARTCGGQQPVGYLGISGIQCDCTISAPGSGRAWSFRNEPRITSLEMDSRAGAVLKIGDVITHVNGKAIRTRDGAQELSNIEPGEAVVLTVRRNGESLKYALTAGSVCPTDTRLAGIYAPKAQSNVVTSVTPTIPAPKAEAPGIPQPAARAPGISAPMLPTPAPSLRASFGMGLSCSGNCSIKISEKNKVARMLFSEPPEVYSIERGGPADKAGIRRGDVLTHIDGKRMDSEAGGERFANAKPGQQVRFTVQRGRERKAIDVLARERSPVSSRLAQSSESLVRARETITELQREQAAQLRKLQQELRKTGRVDEAQLRGLQRELLQTERQHNEMLAALARELTRADTRVRAVLVDSARNACLLPTPAPTAGRSTRTLRYSGTLGNADIEVRGTNPVSVTETRNEVVVTAGGTVVRIKKTD